MKKLALPMVAVLLGLGGCSTPEVTTPRPVGLNGEHVRAAAQAMCTSLLGSPAIAQQGGAVRIKVSDIEDKSRFMIDGNIFLRRFRAELNAASGGRLQFLDSSGSVGEDRRKILERRQRQQLQYELRQLAGYMVRCAELRGRTVTLAAVPALNTNLVGMNADGFMSLLREELVRAGNGNVRFLTPGEVEGADYWLTGEFYPVDAGKVGRVNMAEYLEVIGMRVKEGRSVFIEKDRSPVATASPREVALLRLLDDQRLQKTPDCDLRLNVMLTEPDTSKVIFEAGAQVARAVSDNSESANFILSGEISNLSARRQGVSSDYVLLGFKLVDPESNVMVWEGAYEVEFIQAEGVVYR